MNRKTMIAVLVVALFALAMAGCTRYAGPTQSEGTTPAPAGKMGPGSARLTDADNGKSVDLKEAGTLIVDLEENATTGFAWLPQGEVPQVLKYVTDEQKAAEATGVVGAAGRHVFEYEAAKPGEGDLTLVYARPWESVQPAKTFTVHVVVK